MTLSNRCVLSRSVGLVEFEFFVGLVTIATGCVEYKIKPDINYQGHNGAF